ncbi:MAG: hypothetical protein KDD19_04760 [Phaeodactylibacter sp.]|nr:hypothetical protein [Phaeodactylibacter sp.]MCB9048488.1 hypothetical protein [Lewinellaceae bacterium]
MTEQDQLFAEFSPTTKAEWIAKIEKDLKGKPLDELRWQLEENITLEPFYHPEDVESAPAPLQGHRQDNNWEIGEYIDVVDIKKANAELLEGLQGGAEAPLFRLNYPLNAAQLEQLLEGAELSFISVNFGEYYTDKVPWELFQHLIALLEKRGTDKRTVRGSIDFDPLLDWSRPPIDKLAELIRYCRKDMPLFRPFQVNAHRFHSGPDASSMELAYTIAKGSEYLARLTGQGLSAEAINAHMQFSIAISKSYFVEIAKLRALRLLWANVTKGYGAPQSPFLAVHFAKETQDDDPNTNMIRASTQAMSAVIGGTDRLFVLPANHSHQEPSTAFGRRIARNLQHLLKMESHLHRVIDPGAGSYYIEKLTDKLAEQAWEQFQEMEKKGEFS